MRRKLSLCLALMLSVPMLMGAASPGDEFEIDLNANFGEAVVFDVVVPTSLGVTLTEGAPLCADNVVIENNSLAAVQVSNIELTTADDWEIVSYDNFAGQSGEHVFALCINDVKSTESGFEWAPFIIDAETDYALEYDIKVPAQPDLEETSLGKITLTLNWAP